MLLSFVIASLAIVFFFISQHKEKTRSLALACFTHITEKLQSNYATLFPDDNQNITEEIATLHQSPAFISLPITAQQAFLRLHTTKYELRQLTIDGIILRQRMLCENDTGLKNAYARMLKTVTATTDAKMLSLRDQEIGLSQHMDEITFNIINPIVDLARKRKPFDKQSIEQATQQIFNELFS